MDVTCERCGTEYEFDETLLSGRGTSVKCTNCGYVFKVYAAARTEADSSSNNWRLKLQDGSIDVIDTLRELQRRISAGELTPDNEIAKGDEGWKSLGSIPELETFFQAAGFQVPVRGIRSPVPPSPASPNVTSQTSSSAPPGRRPRQPTLLGVPPVQRVIPAERASDEEAVARTAARPTSASRPGSVWASGPAPASVPESASKPASAPETTSVYESPYSSDTVPPDVLPSWPSSSEIEDAEFEERPRRSGGASARLSAPPPPYYDDDQDIPDLPEHGRSSVRWLVLLVVIGGLALIGSQWARVAKLLGLGSDSAQIAAGVAEGDAGLAEGHPRAYANAIEAYRHSVEAGGDRDPEILAKLSNAYALSAQAQIDAGATAESTEALSAAALTFARSAVEIASQDVSALLAEADALRLASQYVEARKVLDQARAMSFSRTAELYRIDSRLSAAEAGGGLEHGLRSAKQAVELAPQGIPYLLLLARAERASGDDAGARVSLETILADHPDHPVAKELLAALTSPEVALDAGAGADAGTEAVLEPAPEAATTPEAAATTPEAAATTPEAAATAPEAATVPEPAPEAAPAPLEKRASASKPRAVEKPAPKRRSPPQKRAAPRKPSYDEYDQLAKAAGDDAFVDGRPPVRDYEWYMREGRAELAGGNYTRARAFFGAALEARPGSAQAMDGLGWVSMRIEDYESALRYFRVAAQRGHPDGYFNLGKTYERLGRNEEAVSAYYTYIKRRPSGTHATAARLAIKTLEPRAKLPPEPEPSSTEASAQEAEPAAP
ncbi:MAG: zinc-ribbon domain-containing protein [Polyangiales bacterium]